MDNQKDKNFSESKFLIITHTFATGPAQELRDFFIKNKISFSFLEHPFSFNKNQRRSKITFFKKGKEKFFFEGIKINGPDLFHFVKDFFYTIYFIFKTREKYNICVAADNLNTFSAWFLKKFGYIDKLIYWTIDYTPKRFENKFFNETYHWMDRFCCYRAYLTWNSSKRMKEARRKNGVDIKRCAEEIIVQDGCHFEEIERISNEKANRFKLVFMGHLAENKGIDLIIKSMPDLLKEYRRITLTIIGTGPEEKNLKDLVQGLNIQDRVSFTGFIKDHKELEKIIASCGIALAPYLPDPNSYTFFSDVGKVKIYLACGLPVLITDVPEVAQELQREKAGLIFDYSKEDLSKKVGYLLENKGIYFQYRANAIKFAQGSSWDRVFSDALNKTFNIIY
ncbi:glycosyltransferase family 4 protein [Candidatus Parcubacteria bacterium]|nr:glycosyltransferase family 4 protein [Candidatus Parcubacteria bacterium]